MRDPYVYAVFWEPSFRQGKGDELISEPFRGEFFVGGSPRRLPYQGLTGGVWKLPTSKPAPR